MPPRLVYVDRHNRLTKTNDSMPMPMQAASIHHNAGIGRLGQPLAPNPTFETWPTLPSRWS